MIFNFTNFSFIQKCEIKCPESRKKLTRQYKFCLMDADAKRPGEGCTCRLNAEGRGSKTGEILRTSLYNHLLRNNVIRLPISILRITIYLIHINLRPANKDLRGGNTSFISDTQGISFHMPL